MSNILYREEDIEAIDNNIEDIIIKARENQLNTLEPTIKEFNEVMIAIKEYIKKSKRLVYGGYALNDLLRDKNKKDMIYSELDMPDIEFYSPKPIKDLVELCDYLHKKGFKYVEGKEGQHKETYKIFVNFQNYCDISYIPGPVYYGLPYITLNDINYIHPHFMLIDKFRVYNNPLTAYWRLLKEIKRTNIILKNFPLKKLKCDIKKVDQSEVKLSIMKKIRKNILPKMNATTIVFGYYAYYYYMYKTQNIEVKDKKNKVNLYVPYYDLISSDLKRDAIYIKNQLISEYGDKIRVDESYPFSQFQDRSVSYYYGDDLILNLYGTNGVCTPYIDIKKKNIKIAPFILTLMMMMINGIKYKIMKNEIDSDNMECMASNMIDFRIKYLSDTNKTVMDKTPFQEFIVDCIGQAIDPPREYKLNIMRKKEQGKRLVFSYNPDSGATIDTEVYKFPNSSGNKITNKKYWITENGEDIPEDE